MYKMLAEQPIFLSILLAALGLAFLYVWTRGAPKISGIIGGIALALIPLIWLVATAIETDDEAIRGMISQVAADVEANDFDSVYASIHESRPDIKRRAKSELPNYEFTRARVGTFRKVRVLEDRSPRQAVADLNAAVRVSVSSHGLKNQAVVRRLLLLLEETDDGWKVIDYEHRPATGQADSYTNNSGTDWDGLLGPTP